MKNDDIAPELIQALTKAETNFGLSEILEAQGKLKNEPVTVEFKWGDKSLLICQRNIDSSNDRFSWGRASGQCIETLEKGQPSETVGREIAEVLSKSGMLPTFKNVLRKRNITISEKQPVMVQFSFTSGIKIVLKCPCPPNDCCQVAV